MISIQTNVTSLVAQQNLNTNTTAESNTIEQLTSGYRINSSGDDAATNTRPTLASSRRAYRTPTTASAHCKSLTAA